MSMNYRRRWRGVDYGQALSGYRPGQARLRPATYYDRNAEVGPDAQARAMVDRLSRLEDSLRLRDEASRQFAERSGRPIPPPANAPRRPNPFTDGTGQFAGTSGDYDIYDTPNGRAYVDTRTGSTFINGQLFATPGNDPVDGADPVRTPPVAELPAPGTVLPDGSTFVGADEFGTPMVRNADGAVVAGAPEMFGPQPLEVADQPSPTDTPTMTPPIVDSGVYGAPAWSGVTGSSGDTIDPGSTDYTYAGPPITNPPPAAPSYAPVDESSIPAEYRWMFGLGPAPTSGAAPEPPSLGVPGVGNVAGPPTPGSVPVVGSGVYGAAPAAPVAPVAGGGDGTYIDPGSTDYSYAGPPPPPPVVTPAPPPAYDPDDPSTWITA